MKFFSSLIFSTLLATTAFAQSAAIGAPADGSSVQAGSNITVEVDRPDTLTGSTEVAVVIGFLSCNGRPACPAASEVLGSILYNGPFNPQFVTGVSRPPHQNFTVTIPSTFPSGPAQLAVSHFSLVGVSAILLPVPTFRLTRSISRRVRSHSWRPSI
ncbi:hypothetical protein C8F04DRAFT_970561 [Mycena alexandri]|uniref:Uncharacterized protein n=1 Tax=Mycena alexandri TaxID=1745969 RepID=A0AAD6S8X7_9AGAR|nr:hypothetical protein C8F04DRAFT_970561 [Mycena alexandri]